VQAAVFSILAMGQVFALLLGEIDLSIGFVAGLSAVIMAERVEPSVGWPWWLAILAALAVCAAIGALQGSLITRLGLPSFVVTLGGLCLAGRHAGDPWQRRLDPIQDQTINDISSGNLSRVAGWVVMLVIVAVFAVYTCAATRAGARPTAPQRC
jgi:D-xylose transport system permease protein